MVPIFQILSVVGGVAGSIALFISIFLTYKQLKLQERAFLKEQAALLVPYLVLIRDIIGVWYNEKGGSSVIASIMNEPNCPEAKGTFGLYLTYLRNTLGPKAEKELRDIFDIIHKYAERNETLPLDVYSKVFKRVDRLLNEVISKYAVRPEFLRPEMCLKQYNLPGKLY